MRHSEELLLLIDDRSSEALPSNVNPQRAGVHFVPVNAREQYVKALGYTVTLHGAGTARALRSLEERGLVKQVSSTHGYVITEEGRLLAETLTGDEHG